MLKKSRHVTIIKIFGPNISSSFDRMMSTATELKKNVSQNLDTETCVGFFNIEDFNGSCNFSCSWWIFYDIGFLLNIIT